MWKFDSLELIGFKSFGDKTVLRFEQPVTAIIGPNGCGKSNLADAIGWVLGTQSARHLRGEKMEDVIFNGSARRKPSGMAQVTLTLRPVQGEAEEPVEISRKLYRSGESLYLINGRRSRLKDVQQLLEDLGLGYSSYALIAQGKIEAFLAGKPLDRRLFIEEAAGIVGYKSRRRQAELKLEMAQQNLLRVQDILLEVERRLRSLKRQAAKARRYRRLKEEFRALQRQRLAWEGRQARQEFQELREKLERLHQEEAALREELSAREAEYRTQVQQRERLEEQLGALHREYSQAVMEVDRTENALSFQREQVQGLQKQLESNRNEQLGAEKALQEIGEEKAQLEREQEALFQEKEQLEQVLKERQAGLKEYASRVEALEAELERLRSRLMEASAQASALQDRRQQLEQRQQETRRKLAEVEKSRAELQLQLQESSGRLREIGERLGEKEAGLQQVRESLAQLESRREEALRFLQEQKQKVADCRDCWVGLKERLQSLQEVELSRSHYSEGVQTFLRHLSQSNVMQADGTLAEHIETSPQFERLVEEFLDEELEYVVVDSFQEARRGISELKTLKSGKCTFLSLRSNGFPPAGQGGPEEEGVEGEGVVGTLLQILKMRPEVQEAFRRALPQQASSVVVTDLNRAFELAHRYPRSTFLTLEGEALSPRGLLSGSSVSSAKLGLLGLKRRKRELHSRLEAAQRSLKKEEAELARQQAALEKLDREAASLKEAGVSLEKELLGLQHERDQWKRELQRQQQGLAKLQEELSLGQSEQKRREQELKEIGEGLEGARRRQREAEGLLESGQEELKRLQGEQRRAQEQLHLSGSHHKVIEERLASLEGTLERLREQTRTLTQRQAGLKTSAQEIQERLQAARQRIGKLEEHLVGERGKVEETRRRRDALQSQYESQKNRLPELEEQLQELRRRRDEWQEKGAALEVARARVETILSNLQVHCREELGLSLEAILAEPSDSPAPPDLPQAYQELKARLESFGPINMTALEEYQQCEERRSFLSRQKEDIEKSIQDTSKAIQEINRRSRKMFREAFEAINGNFQEIFRKLFGGGECGIQLIDEEDPLESGIDVFAQPPGKRLQNVMLLSGGEKALTVFALLVALFQYRPSQFCVLDEVDAPLDDANVLRFNNLIQDLSRHTQFIIVTHNKRTMERADTIFGVTMEEPGVSQVVSVQLSQVPALT